MHVESSFITDSEPSELIEPCETAFDHPSVAPELLAGLKATPGDARLDSATQAGASAAPVIVGLVRVQLVGSSSRLAALPATGGTASSSSSNGTLSWTLAPVKRNASGMPCRSVIR